MGSSHAAERQEFSSEKSQSQTMDEKNRSEHEPLPQTEAEKFFAERTEMIRQQAKKAEQRAIKSAKRWQIFYRFCPLCRRLFQRKPEPDFREQFSKKNHESHAKFTASMEKWNAEVEEMDALMKELEEQMRKKKR